MEIAESYRIYQNAQLLCKYRGCTVTRAATDQAAFLALIDSNQYAGIDATRPADDIRGEARILVAQLSAQFNIETTAVVFEKFLNKLISAGRGEIPLNIIILTTGVIGRGAQKKLDERNANKQEKILIEVIHYSRLSIVVPEHVMTPRHTIVSDEDFARITQSRFIQRGDLPAIIVSGPNPDAMAVWMGLRPGMIVRLDRDAETCGTMVAYRVCV